MSLSFCATNTGREAITCGVDFDGADRTTSRLRRWSLANRLSAGFQCTFADFLARRNAGLRGRTLPLVAKSPNGRSNLCLRCRTRWGKRGDGMARRRPQQGRASLERAEREEREHQTSLWNRRAAIAAVVGVPIAVAGVIVAVLQFASGGGDDSALLPSASSSSANSALAVAPAWPYTTGCGRSPRWRCRLVVETSRTFTL